MKNGAFPSDTSTIACITVFLPSVGGNITGAGNFCGNAAPGILNLTGKTGNVLKWEISINNGTSWATISNTTTTLSHGNITQNTLYRAIVQNGAMCDNDTSSVANFIINPNTVAGSISSMGTNTVCYASNSNTFTLSGNVGNVINWITTFDNGTNWNPISNTTSTLISSNITATQQFAAVVQSANCAIDTTNNIKLTVLAQNTVNAGADTTISQGQSVMLNGSGMGTPLWLPSTGIQNPGALTTSASPDATTNYVLTLTDANSCVVSDTVIITVLPLKFEGVITTVFSPNGDGINDNWFIENIKFYPENEVAIYNINGNTVYTTKGYNNDWQGTYNGSPLPDGTYFYVIKIDEDHQIIKGSVDILRSK